MTSSTTEMNDGSPDGLQRVLKFLDRLDNAGVHFVIDQERPQSLLIRFTLVGTRVEVEATPEQLSYRQFGGNEDVHNDLQLLDRLVGNS